MTKRFPSRIFTLAGFTLVELMIVIVIATILLAVAIPSYTSQIRKSRRTEAKTALLDLASREERLLSTTNVYSDDPVNLGYTGNGANKPFNVGSGYYQITIAVTAANPAAVPPTVATFTMTAAPQGTQALDTQCQQFAVNSTGTQSAIDGSAADSTQTCWR
jgi:type IV pilus assembly protein PilE